MDALSGFLFLPEEQLQRIISIKPTQEKFLGEFKIPFTSQMSFGEVHRFTIALLINRKIAAQNCNTYNIVWGSLDHGCNVKSHSVNFKNKSQISFHNNILTSLNIRIISLSNN